MEYMDVIVTVGSIVLSVVLGVVAKKYSNKYGQIIETLKDVSTAVADGKVTKEELAEIINDITQKNEVK